MNEEGPDIFKIQLRKRVTNLCQNSEERNQNLIENLQEIPSSNDVESFYGMLSRKENKVNSLIEEREHIQDEIVQNLKNINSQKTLQKAKDIMAGYNRLTNPEEIGDAITIARNNSRKCRNFGLKLSKYMEHVSEFDTVVSNESRMNDEIRMEKTELQNRNHDLSQKLKNYQQERTKLLYAIEQWQQLIFQKDSTLVTVLRREEMHVSKLKFKLAIYQIEDERRDIAIANLFKENIKKDVDIESFREQYYSCLNSLELERKFYEELDRKLGHRIISDLEDDEEAWMDEALKVSFEHTATSKPSNVKRELKRKNKELNEFTNRVLIDGDDNFQRIRRKRGKGAILSDEDITEMVYHLTSPKTGTIYDVVGDDDDDEREDSDRFTDITNRSHKIRKEMEEIDLKLIEIKTHQETTSNSIKTVIQKIQGRKRTLGRLQKGYAEAKKGKQFKNMSEKKMMHCMRVEKRRIAMLEDIMERAEQRLGRMKVEELKFIERKSDIEEEHKRIVGEKVFLVRSNMSMDESTPMASGLMKKAYFSGDLRKKNEPDLLEEEEEQEGEEEEEEGEEEQKKKLEKKMKKIGEEKKKREFEMRKSKRDQIEKELSGIAVKEKQRGKGEKEEKEEDYSDLKKKVEETGSGSLKNVFESIVVEELKRKKETVMLTSETHEVKSSIKFRKKRMDLLMKYYQARNVRAKSILGDKEIGELTTQNLIYELEGRLKEQKDIVEKIKEEGEKQYNEEEYEKLLKIFAGDAAYVRIKFLRKNKHSQTTPIMIDQKHQAGESRGLHVKDEETQIETKTEAKEIQVDTISENNSSTTNRIRKKLRNNNKKLLPVLSIEKVNRSNKKKGHKTPSGKDGEKKKKRRSVSSKTPIDDPRKEGGVFGKGKMKNYTNSFTETSKKYVNNIFSEDGNDVEKKDVSIQRILRHCDKGVHVVAETRNFQSQIVFNDVMEDESTSMGDLSSRRSSRRSSSSHWDLDSDFTSRRNSAAAVAVVSVHNQSVQCGSPKMIDQPISVDLYGKSVVKCLEFTDDGEVGKDESEVRKKPRQKVMPKGSKTKNKKNNNKKKKKRTTKKRLGRVSSSSLEKGEEEEDDDDEEEEEESGVGGDEDDENNKKESKIIKKKKKKVKRKKVKKKKVFLKTVKSKDIGIETMNDLGDDFGCQVSNVVEEKIVEVTKKMIGTPEEVVEMSSVCSQVSFLKFSEVESKKVQTRAIVKKDWWVHDSDSVEVQASPVYFDCDTQAGPDGYDEIGIQNTVRMKNCIQQFPSRRLKYRDQLAQTQTSYVRRIVRTFDKYIQADSFHKVRFKILERIPSQEIGLVKVVHEKNIQATPKARNSSMQTFTRIFNVSCQTRPAVLSQASQVCLKPNTSSRYIQVYQNPTMQKRIQTSPPDTHKTVQTMFRNRNSSHLSRPVSPRSPRLSQTEKSNKRRSKSDQSYFQSQQEMIRQLEADMRSKDNKVDSLKEQHKKHVIELKKRFKDEMMKKDHDIKLLKRENLSNSQTMNDYKRKIDTKVREEREKLQNESISRSHEAHKHVSAHNRRMEADYMSLKKKFNIRLNQHKDILRVEFQKKEKEFEQYKSTLLNKYEETLKLLERERSTSMGMKRDQRSLRKECEEGQDQLHRLRKESELDIRNCKVQIRYLNRVIKEKKEESVKSAILHRVDEVVVSELEDIRQGFNKTLKDQQIDTKIKLQEVGGEVRDQFRVRDDMIQKLRFELCQREEEVENIIEAQKQDGKNLRKDLHFLKDLLVQKEQEIDRLRNYIVAGDLQRPTTATRPNTGSSIGSTGRPTTGYSIGKSFRRSPRADGKRPQTSCGSTGRSIHRTGKVYRAKRRPQTASSSSSSPNNCGLPTIQFKRPKTSSGSGSGRNDRTWDFFDEANSTRRRVMKRKKFESSKDESRILDSFPNFAPPKKAFSGSFYNFQNNVKKRNQMIVGRTKEKFGGIASGTKKTKGRKLKNNNKTGTFCLSGISLDL